MAYRFKLAEPIQAGFQRIGLEQIQRAERELARAADHDATIHETRKCLKRVRALLRLARPGLKDKEFAAANERFRQLGALLSEARDNQVMLHTVAKLEADGARAPLQGLKKLIVAGRGGSDSAFADPGLAAAAISDLAEARSCFEELKLAPRRFDVLRDGLERSYRHGRRMMREAFNKGDDDSFHELRKRVQQQWRHMQLLENAWPQLCSARAAAARELSQILGDDQDLSVLKAYLRRVPRTQIGPLEAKSIRGAIRAQQKELRAAAAPRAQRLFAERPEDLGRHIAILWSSARNIGQFTRVHDGGAVESQDAAPRLKAVPADPVAVGAPIR